MKQLKLLCWNVNGVRAVKGRGFLPWLYHQSPDVLCIQETKAHPEELDPELRQPQGYYGYWNHPVKKGYAGVAIYTRQEPEDVQYDFGMNGFDSEGRAIICRYPGFTLLNIYFPNGKQSQERLDYKMRFYDVFLDYVQGLRARGEKLVICGDFNTAHKEIDLARPKANEKISGFLPMERAWMDKFIAHGYVDTLRHFHKEPDLYTWWHLISRARERNVGWRIDYFFITENLLPSLTSAFIMPEVAGSDHCPVGITLKLD